MIESTLDFSGLSNHEQELLELLLAEEGIVTQREQPIPFRPPGVEVSLSFGQQRLWFLERLQPGSGAYNLFLALAVSGRLAPAALAAALGEIVRRHEVLRTCYRLGLHGPIQVVQPAPTAWLLPLVDLSTLPAAQREPEGRRVAAWEARRGFDLERGPVFRSVLLREGDERHTLLLATHHIASDGWSQDVLLAELGVLYEAVVAGRPSLLPELSIQYGDFALWQRQPEQEQRFVEQLDHWAQRLAGFSQLELPTDRPRAGAGRRGALVDFYLPAAPMDELRALCERERATPFMALLAVFQILLARYTGRHDVIVGSPTAGRDRVELEPLVGFFVNNLILRTDLSGNPGFRESIGRVREVTAAALAHADIPFERLVEALQVPRVAGRSPIFDVAFAFQSSAGRTARAVAGLDFYPRWVELVSAKFELTLTLDDTPGTPVGSIEYRTDLFDAATVRRLAEHLRVLIAGAAHAPDCPIGELPLLTAGERRQLLALAGRPQAAPVACLHVRFVEQARRTPDAVAVSFAGAALTYGELERRSARVARRLTSLRGVRPGDLVALCMERSAETIVALLGILRAGAAYIPLEPAQPSERVRFVLADTRATTVITGDTVGPVAADDALPLRLLWSDDESTDRGVPEPSVPVESAAYVIYTSGSTGRPKGVMVSHANAARLFTGSAPWLGFERGDIWSLYHSLAFDFSVWEIWGALLHGGRLAVVPYLVSRAPEDFHRFLAEEQVTMLSVTPSAFRQLMAVDSLHQGGRLPLRTVVFGGEALDLPALRPWLERHGEERPQLVNMYGITETTVHVTYRPVGTADLRPACGSAIGVPLPDLSVYVLDPGGALAPVGVPGELCVGGDGVAQAYLGRPDFTAERFLPDPFSGRAGARLYRSGDLGRRLPDMQLEHLGRIDKQVKVRGFRIELGEIEAALRDLPEIRDAVVVTRDGASGDRRLVAYLVTGGSPPLSPDVLRRQLGVRLPDYMVPAAFVTIEEIPLTSNGKLDDRALPAPGAERPDLEQAYVAPRTPLEEALVAIWQQALGLERIGVHDNFFALGGDSILSVRLLALAQDRGLRLSLPQLFLHQTVGDLARALETEDKAPDHAAASAPFSLLDPADRQRLPHGLEDAYPLSSLQAGMLYHMCLNPESPLYHNINGFRVRSPWDQAAFERAVARVVRRHPVLRTGFDTASFSEPLQLVHREAVLPIEVVDLRPRPAAEQQALLAELARREKRQPFDLARPPLLRFHIHRLNEDSFQFTLTENHAILDGWSLQSTLAEIFAEYRALLAGRPLPEPPPLASSFREFIRLERQTLRAEPARRYWLEKLDGVALTPLPQELRQGGKRPAPRVEVWTTVLAEEVLTGLQRLARRLAVPLKSALLAAHVRVMALICGQKEVLTGLVVNGRPEAADGDRARGLFLNTVPLRLPLAGGTWEELVAAVFRLEVEALRYRRFPLAELQRLLGGELAVETCFNYVHFHVLRDAIEAGGLEVTGSGASMEETNFKLLANFLRAPAGDDDRVTFSLQVDLAVLPLEAARSFFERYLRTLARIASTPGERHELAPLLFEHERQQVLRDWNPPLEPAAEEVCLHELFGAAAAESPDAVALVDGERLLSYAELDRRATRLARRLRRHGAGPEVRVGIAMERSSELVIGLLAILKAGAVYVPLDPSYPRERLDFIVEDARIEVVVGDAAAGALAFDGCEVLSVDAAAAGPAAALDAVRVHPDNGAYVIYTSGSTGLPKGVLVTHRNVVRLFRATAPWYGFGPRDVWTLFHSYAFDFSVWEMWGALLFGGRLVIVPWQVSRSPEAFYRLLARERVSILNQTPSAFRQLIACELTGEPEGLALREVIFGGESLDLGSLTPWFERHGDERPRLVNMYGITETTVHVTYRPVGCADTAGGSVIGRPIGDLAVYVLDHHQQLVPPGVPGEVFVAGAGIARGYLDRPELTASRFLPSPWSDSPGGRLYRTGDLARHLPGGDLEYLGRIDHQVKVRGFRIELGEIESVLAQHSAVREAAVVLQQQGNPGDQRLLAYAVPVAEPPQASHLRAFLADRLPAYMVPAAVMVVEALPLTPSGKVDRRALAQRTVPAARDEQAALAPRTPMEEVLAGLWSSLLGGVEVGPDDSFFELGGHSLLAMTVIGRVRELCHVDLPLQALFEHPTVAELARAIEAARLAGAPSPSPLARREAPGERIGASFMQRQLWLTEQRESSAGAQNIPILLQVRGPLAIPTLAAAQAQVIERHEILRTRFEEHDDELFQVIEARQPLAVPVVDLSALPAAVWEAEVRRAGNEESRRRFDLARGPLLRLLALRRSAGEHMLLLSLHHIVADARSMEILVGEFMELYRAARQGEAAPLSPMPLQFADVAEWQRATLTPEVQDRHLAFWRGRLAGLKTELFAPRPGFDPASTDGGMLPVALDEETSAELRRLALRCRASLFMVLLALYKLLLARRTRQGDIAVGSPISLRDRAEIEGLIGPFLNLVILRTRLSGDQTFEELVERVRYTVLEATAHRALPFELVAEELRRTGTARGTLAQAVFTLQVAGAARADRGDLSISAVPFDRGRATFDLQLNLIDRRSGLTGFFEYRTGYFNAEAVQLLAELFKTAAAAVSRPQTRLDELWALLSERELGAGEIVRRAAREAGSTMLRSVRRRSIQTDPN